MHIFYRALFALLCATFPASVQADDFVSLVEQSFPYEEVDESYGAAKIQTPHMERLAAEVEPSFEARTGEAFVGSHRGQSTRPGRTDRPKASRPNGLLRPRRSLRRELRRRNDS